MHAIITELPIVRHFNFCLTRILILVMGIKMGPMPHFQFKVKNIRNIGLLERLTKKGNKMKFHEFGKSFTSKIYCDEYDLGKYDQKNKSSYSLGKKYE